MPVLPYVMPSDTSHLSKYTDVFGAPLLRPHVYEIQSTQGPDRIACGPAGSCVSLMRALVADLQPPVFMLFVLRISRCGQRCGRYQSDLLGLEVVDAFVSRYSEFLDRDARQELWVGTPDGSSLLVWDEHQIVYGYGDLERMQSIARAAGLSRGSVLIASPHAHNYHDKFDAAEAEILSRYAWQWSPHEEPDD